MGERKANYFKDSDEISMELENELADRLDTVIESGEKQNIIHTDHGEFNMFIDHAPRYVSQATKEVDKKVRKYHKMDGLIYDQVISDIMDIIAGEAEWASLEDNS